MRLRLWILGVCAAALACALAGALGTVRVTVALEPPGASAHAPFDLPTTTPPPPTATLPAPPSPSAPPATPPPTATSAPPTATPPPTERPTDAPREHRARPTEVPPSPTVAPTAPAAGADVSVEKRAEPAVMRPGERVVFTITVANRGRGAARDVVLTDAIPAALQVVDLRSEKGDIVVRGQEVTAYPRDLAPGEVRTYSVAALVRADAPAGALANTAVATTSTPDSDPGNNASTATVTVRRPAAPRLPRTADPLLAQGFLAIYWPLLALAAGALAAALAVRAGAFRLRTLRVTVGLGPADGGALELDPSDLVARWRAGASVGELAADVAGRSPRADRTAAALAVQRVIGQAIRGERAGGPLCD